MKQNFIIVRDKSWFSMRESREFLEFNCSYGWSTKGAANNFNLKTKYDGTLIPLGSFIQLSATNWCGKITNIDVDFKEKTVLYTGVSLYGYMDFFIPVRQPEELTCLSITSVNTYGQGQSTAKPMLDAIVNQYKEQMTNKSVRTRLGELCNKIRNSVRFAESNTTPGSMVNPNDSSWIAKYTSYKFYTLAETEYIFYGSDGNIYYNENPPSGVTTQLTVRVAKDTVTLDCTHGMLESFEPFLDINSYTDIRIASGDFTFTIGNNNFDENDNILLDQFTSPIYYHEHKTKNIMPLEHGIGTNDPVIMCLDTRYDELIHEETTAYNDYPFSSLDGSHVYTGADLWFIAPEGEDGWEARENFKKYLKDEKLVFDHSLAIYNSEDEEYKVGKIYNLLSFDAGINIKARLYEKTIRATTNNQVITYNFRQEPTEE